MCFKQSFPINVFLFLLTFVLIHFHRSLFSFWEQNRTVQHRSFATYLPQKLTNTYYTRSTSASELQLKSIFSTYALTIPTALRMEKRRKNFNQWKSVVLVNRFHTKITLFIHMLLKYICYMVHIYFLCNFLFFFHLFSTIFMWKYVAVTSVWWYEQTENH